MIAQSRIDSHLEGFRAYLEEKGYSLRSNDTYCNTAKRFLVANPWGDEYKYSDVVDYFGRLSKTPLTVTSRKGILGALKRYYDYLQYSKYRKDHPCRSFLMKGGRDRGIIPSDLFSMEDLEELMQRENDWGKQPLRNKVIFSLYIYQGLATEDITKLNLTDVDMDKGLIHIRGGRKRSSRVLELNPRQYNLIQNYLSYERRRVARNKSPHRFILNQYGEASSLDSISDSLLLVKEAFPGRQLGAMSIRQSVMMYWINVMKIPIEEVQLLAGIRWVSSIERYQHITPTEEHAVLKMYHPLG